MKDINELRRQMEAHLAQARAIRADAQTAEGDWARYIKEAERHERAAHELRAAIEKEQKRRDLAKIHIGAKQLGMDDEARRDFICQHTGKRSAADLLPEERNMILHRLRALGATFRGKRRPRPAKSKAAMAKKIVAIMKDLGYTDAYVDGMAQKMFGVERWEWLDDDQTERLLVALVLHQKRKERAAP